ncbi:OCR-2 protein [Aphelenchoides avenae]|nr:OCR-2 protein [Aphelenchus avenae]
MVYALKLLDGGKSGKGESKYREVVWKLEERGNMGENLVGVCLMQGGAVHNALAQKLMEAYPKLVNDIFLSEDYYGLSPLHQAIVNEDPRMTAFLLKNGADVNQRCYGAFFCPEDQKGSRTDSVEHEYVELSLKTEYTGRMYFGEYPLSFAACIEQFDCYRLLRAKQANPNLQDTNGNTVLHMVVIHEKLDMLKYAYKDGAKLQIMNKQNLTPLTLAAKLAKKMMFDEILKLESNVVWNYGDASSISYPLAKIDTINQETGELNEDSALSLVVYGDSEQHLDLLDGLLEDLLQAKWEAFGKRNWIKSLSAFVFYYILVFMAFMNRPFSMTTNVVTDGWLRPDGQMNKTAEAIWNCSRAKEDGLYCPSDFAARIPFILSTTPSVATQDEPTFTDDWFQKRSCHLWRYGEYNLSGTPGSDRVSAQNGLQSYVRMVCEPAILLLVIVQLIIEAWDIRRIGFKRWWQVLKSFPSKVLYKASLILIVMLVPTRLLCGLSEHALLVDNMISMFCVIMTTTHFLFYFRALRFVGPFILMVYKIIAQDMARFMLIYGIFVMGFSQAFFVIFNACQRECEIAANASHPPENPKDPNVCDPNIMRNPLEAIVRVFMTTINEFTTLYRNMHYCGRMTGVYTKGLVTQPNMFMSTLGKGTFIVFELIVSLMQFNLLIAMMTRTYEMIYRTQKEYKRQWAQVILMLELSMNPKDRLMALLKYSRPIGTDKRKRAFVVSRKVEQTEDERDKRQLEEEKMREERRQLLKRRLKVI